MPASIGPESLPAALVVLRDELADVAQRQSVTQEMTEVALAAPETRATVVDALAAALEAYDENPPALNAELIRGLMRLRADAAHRAIEDAFAMGRVDERLITFEQVLAGFALMPGLVAEPERPAPRAKPADKAKAKRKATRQARKQNRRD
ncbi:MAG TPA: hypothetical protein V6D47_19345 [Oscillatoriaceae cyanobacterium]